MSSDINSKIIRDFSRAAKTYDTYATLQRKVANRLFRDSSLIQNKLTYEDKDTLSIENRDILDIGCGTGYFHELLRKNKIYLPLVQLDISHAMSIESANYASPPEYGGTYTCTADMHFLPFKSSSFSNIFSSMTLQWSQNISQVLKEIKRTLKDKGNFAFSIVADGSLYELKDVFISLELEPRIHQFLTKSFLENELKKSNLYVEKFYSETIQVYYDDISSMFKAIKKVGASYKGKDSSGLKSKNYLRELETKYREKYESSNSLPLSWNIIYVIGRNG